MPKDASFCSPRSARCPSASGSSEHHFLDRRPHFRVDSDRIPVDTFTQTAPLRRFPPESRPHGRPPLTSPSLAEDTSMLQINRPRRHPDCDGKSRRDFLKIGALGATGLVLPDLLRARAQAAGAGTPTKNTSVVWLWLGGGPTHVETFDPKMSAPAEYRSVTGSVKT